MMDIDRSAFGPDTTTDEGVDGLDLSDLSVPVSYTHLDVYKRQV